MAIVLTRGLLERLIPDEIVEPIPEPELEGFVAGLLDDVEGDDRAIGAALFTMASDLTAPPTIGLDPDVDAAAAEHAGQTAVPDPDFGVEVAAAEASDFELARLAGELPPDESNPDLPPVNDRGDRFDGEDPIDYAWLREQIGSLWGSLSGFRDLIARLPGPGGGGSPGPGPGPGPGAGPGGGPAPQPSPGPGPGPAPPPVTTVPPRDPGTPPPVLVPVPGDEEAPAPEPPPSDEPPPVSDGGPVWDEDDPRYWKYNDV